MIIGDCTEFLTVLLGILPMYKLVQNCAQRIIGASQIKKRRLSYENRRFGVGGDDGSRTRVRKLLAKTFYERSRCFKSPLVQRPTTGFAPWQLLMCDKARSKTLFTFTTNRRPSLCRGAHKQDEQCLRQLLIQLYFCQLFLSCGFYGGSAPPLAY